MSEFTLTAENYFSTEASKKFMSVSQFKTFMDCEARALAEINGDYVRPGKDAFLQGHYVEAALIGDLRLFCAQHPELMSTRGKSKGGLLSKYSNLDISIDYVENDPFFMSFLKGDHQVVKTGFINGVPFKIMIDILAPDRIVDLKAMRDFKGIWKDGHKLNFVEAWGYDIQGAVYRNIEGNDKPFYLAAVTKESVPDKAIIEFDNDDYTIALDIVEEHAPKFQSIKLGIIPPERCGHCDYCKSTKMLTEIIGLDELPV